MSVSSPRSDSHVHHAEGPSACCLLYLFADQVVEHSTILSHLDAQHGVRLPCGKTPVQLGPLERLVFAWAFWNLRERGLIELNYLEPVEHDDAKQADPDDRLPLDIAVKRVGDLAGGQGVEADVLRACGAEDELIGPVLRRWAGEHLPLPIYAVVRALHLEVASFGLVELKDQENGLDPFTDHRVAHFASEDCERITGLEPRFAGLLAAWREFGEQRPQAATDLEEQCRLGLFDLRPPPIMAMGTAPPMH